MEYASDEDTMVLDDPLQILQARLAVAEDDELRQLLVRETAESAASAWTVQVIRNEMQRRVDETARLERDALLADPIVLEDLHQDPSYQDDAEFTPNPDDLQRFSVDENSEQYDEGFLHAEEGVQRIVTLSRTQETASVSFDGYSTITLRMPSAPDRRENFCTLSFTFSDTQTISEFAALLGSEISVDAMRQNTLGASVESGDGYDYFESTVVPLALEIVQIDGKQQYRLPEVVWERFGRYSKVSESIDKIV